MPKPGFKSLTVRDSVYKLLQKMYDDNEEELFYRGIHSISALHTAILTEWVGSHDLPHFNHTAHKRGLEKILRSRKRK